MNRSARRRVLTPAFLLAALSALPLAAASKVAPPAKNAAAKELLTSDTLSGLELRSIGPAVTSGRIVDLAIPAGAPRTWYAAAASGGVWKSENAGTTWAPIFDGEASYSIGCLAVDPKNPNVLWVGTGENNSQRSVSYGDGVYLTLDGGKSFKNVGLESSEHLGDILIDPRDSKTVYVAAQGPLWAAGGERGVYKTTDQGATWKQVLRISDDTGASDLAMDPRDPDVIYATAYQRRRHVWTLIDGGPESAIYKTTDGGATWRKVDRGLPKVDLGRIGLAVSPADPDVVYALVEAEPGEGGFYRSRDRGESWEKRGGYGSTSPQYYQELVADPLDVDRVYSMDTYLQVTDDGGATWRNLGEKSKHVDNHAMWIDPADARHYVVGCDGGIYESFDRGATWRFFENLPITQFYRVAVDDARPVYHVYGGTQDNATLGGPSRTLAYQGPANEDWFVVQGGDGFWAAIDPNDPNIVYGEYQHGGLTRFDRKSGENVDIQPQTAPGEAPARWNWDAPLVLSAHAPTRLYFASQRLYRSDDRGDSWRAISPDLTRQIDRNRLKVFGKVQKPDAVAKNASTSFYGNVVALAESPRDPGLLYAGTDDGLVQVTEDGGGSWRRIERFPGVPDGTYVSRLLASRHGADVLYAAFDNHKMADFKPYVARSADRGRTWVSIAGDLPERGSVYALAEDPVRPDLLFAGTEFGLFATFDGGKKWIQLKGGLPTIQVRDLALQSSADDLVLATFGRGFYVLDDLAPLRGVTATALESPVLLFPPRTAGLFVPRSRIGARDKGFLGETFYAAANPPFGATLSYYLKEERKSAKQRRQASEKEAFAAKKELEVPSFDSLRAESQEESPVIVATVRDAEGGVVRRLEGPATAGFHRLTWDLRYPASDPVPAKVPDDPDYVPPQGPFAAPGHYTVELALRLDGVSSPLAPPAGFEVEALDLATLPAEDRGAVLAFQQKLARLQRAVLGAEQLVGQTTNRLALVRKALRETPALDPALDAEAHRLELALETLRVDLSGDSFLRRRNEPTPPSISERVQAAVLASWTTTARPTATQEDAYRIAGEAFGEALTKLRSLVEGDLATLERKLESAGAPWTPGRIPEWHAEP